jgi:hypothetical protein
MSAYVAFVLLLNAIGQAQAATMRAQVPAKEEEEDKDEDDDLFSSDDDEEEGNSEHGDEDEESTPVSMLTVP